jgi:xylose ABC transporter
LPADEKAHTVSETYQKEVLDVDRNGYEGLLMNNRMVCGVKGYFVDKEAIESFFDRCR